jgi:hypothetical protein
MLKQLLEESKFSKNGIDIGDGYSVHKIGYDINGNWTYWIKYGNKSLKQIQAINILNGRNKVVNINDFKVDETNEIKNEIKKYYSKYIIK